MSIRNSLLLVMALAGPALADWSAIGPYGGPMMSGASSPANGQVIYASPQSYPTNFLKSTDGGEHWTFCGQAGYFAFDIAFHPTDPNVGWAAIGSAVKTTNAGTTWSYMSMPGGTYARSVKVHPANPLLVMTAGYVYINNTSRFGICVSTDGGTTWDSTCVDTMTYSMGYAVAFDPVDPNVAYAGGYSGTNMYVFKSTDAGQTWNRSLVMASGYYIYSLHVSPLDRNVVLAAGYTGIFRSADAGANWQRVATPFNVMWLAASPTDPAKMYACTDTMVWRSADTGRTWEMAGGRTPGHGNRCGFTTTENPDIVYCGARAGVYKSTDRGTTWRGLTDNFSFAKVTSIGLSPAEPQTFYAEYKDNAVFKSTDNGVSWTRCPDFLSCGNICGIVPDRANPAVVWALEGSG